ncbi:MAG TPA: glycosyltransferase [Solirubrobacteraceae bacterium]|nr:glycosyltransferase [Solirubrobacteraceae bacterium]
MRFAFFGSSLVSSYWNGACTYYRGLVRCLHERGHAVDFYEPIAYRRQEHRDIGDPDYARVVIYPAETEAQVLRTVESARGSADVVVKCSGVGVHDALLEAAVLDLGAPVTIFWDVDAPATLAQMESDPDDALRGRIGEYDLVLTYGGGDPVVSRYRAIGARDCIPVYNALDPTTHHPVAPREELRADLAFLGNRLPDREARVEEFFFRAVAALPGRSFLLGGNGWDDRVREPNLRYLGHVSTRDHNALNCSPLSVLNVSRESMAANGWSPATRVFEAAGAGACLITDAWQGIEEFLEPGREVLVARDGAEVAAQLDALDPARARAVGEAARARVLAEHTYMHRAEQVEAILSGARL